MSNGNINIKCFNTKLKIQRNTHNSHLTLRFYKYSRNHVNIEVCINN